jgi:MFS transporter, VNT family, synaptic vesicle glycoprotein 2
VCGLIYLNTAVAVTILSFVLPSATCDFQLTSQKKGWLTAAPMLGMVLGSYFWGCLADTKGRKIVLIASLFMDGICGLLSSVSQYYLLFVFFRFLNGFA